MGTFISWMRSGSGWVRSPFGDLPRLQVDDTAVHQTWLILAGGIALVLSRASGAELESRFAAARQVHGLVRARLHKRRLPKPEPDLLRTALDEIANLADPMTKEAGRECLARCIERQAAKAGGLAPPSTSAAPSALSLAPASTQASTAIASSAAPVEPAAEDHQPTQIDLDLLFERSHRLRDAVAWARTTSFGPEG